MATKADVKLTRAELERAFNVLTWKVISIQLLGTGAIIVALKFL